MKLRLLVLTGGISVLMLPAVIAGEISVAEHHLSITLPES
jgi:hypothetical protein